MLEAVASHARSWFDEPGDCSTGSLRGRVPVGRHISQQKVVALGYRMPSKRLLFEVRFEDFCDKNRHPGTCWFEGRLSFVFCNLLEAPTLDSLALEQSKCSLSFWTSPQKMEVAFLLFFCNFLEGPTLDSFVLVQSKCSLSFGTSPQRHLSFAKKRGRTSDTFGVPIRSKTCPNSILQTRPSKACLLFAF